MCDSHLLDMVLTSVLNRPNSTRTSQPHQYGYLICCQCAGAYSNMCNLEMCLQTLTIAPTSMHLFYTQRVCGHPVASPGFFVKKKRYLPCAERYITRFFLSNLIIDGESCQTVCYFWSVISQSQLLRCCFLLFF